MGLNTIEIAFSFPEVVNISDGVINGQVIFTAKSDQHVKSIKVALAERIVTGTGYQVFATANPNGVAFDPNTTESIILV